jgi:imidazole glycerol-phosphate synthase subunit HisF
MIARRIIPCLDIRDGRVVKGIRFSDLCDAGDPAELASMYQDQGADELVLLDVSATAEGRSASVACIRKVREHLSIPLAVGGGVRCTRDAAMLLAAGADKVAINTAAVRDPSLIRRMSREFGSQCTILALDAARRPPAGWEVITCSGRERSSMNAIDWSQKAVDLGAGEILLTSWDRDGTRIGYDLELLRAITSVVCVPVIASGGAATPEHLLEALQCGADAVLAASIFHFGDTTVGTVKRFLSSRDVEVRP